MSAAGTIPPREASLGWIVRALALELHCSLSDPSDSVREYAEALLLDAERRDPPIEVEAIVNWIHNEHKGEEWNLPQWRSYAEAYCALKRSLGLEGPPPQESF